MDKLFWYAVRHNISNLTLLPISFANQFDFPKPSPQTATSQPSTRRWSKKHRDSRMNLFIYFSGAGRWSSFSPELRIGILCSRLQRLSGGSTTQQRIRFQPPAHAGSTSPRCLRFAEMRCPTTSIGVHQSIKLMFQPTVHFGLLAPLFHSFTTYNKKYFRVFFSLPRDTSTNK